MLGSRGSGPPRIVRFCGLGVGVFRRAGSARRGVRSVRSGGTIVSGRCRVWGLGVWSGSARGVVVRHGAGCSRPSVRVWCRVGVSRLAGRGPGGEGVVRAHSSGRLVRRWCGQVLRCARVRWARGRRGVGRSGVVWLRRMGEGYPRPGCVSLCCSRTRGVVPIVRGFLEPGMFAKTAKLGGCRCGSGVARVTEMCSGW